VAPPDDGWTTPNSDRTLALYGEGPIFSAALEFALRQFEDEINEKGIEILVAQRRNRIDNSRWIYQVAIGRRHDAKAVLILVANRDIRIMTPDGTLLRHLTLHPKRIYQPLGTCQKPCHDVALDFVGSMRPTGGVQ
jgi:hypothetical protein